MILKRIWLYIVSFFRSLFFKKRSQSVIEFEPFTFNKMSLKSFLILFGGRGSSYLARLRFSQYRRSKKTITLEEMKEFL